MHDSRRSTAYRSSTPGPEDFDFDAEAAPLRAKWERVRSALAVGHRERIAALVETRSFYLRTLTYRGAFRRAARRKGILQGRLETQVLRFVHGIDCDTSRTPVNRYGDVLHWLADQRERDEELVERASKFTLEQIQKLYQASVPGRNDNAESDKGANRFADFHSEMLELLAAHEPTELHPALNVVAIFIERIDGSGEVLRYGPIYEQKIIRDAIRSL